LAEQALTKAVAEVEAGIMLVHGGGSAPVSTDGHVQVGLTTAPASNINAAKKALARATKAFEAAQAERKSALDAFKEIISAEASCLQCEADVSIANQYPDPEAASSSKAAQAALKAAEKERGRVEKLLEKCQHGAVAAQDQSVQAVSTLSEATTALADALSALGQGTTQKQVKEVQSEVKAPTRRLNGSLQTVRAAYDAQLKACVLFRKASKSAVGATASSKEAHARLCFSEREHAAAEDDVKEATDQRSKCETDLASARAAMVAAEAHEISIKRNREEVKAALGDAKQSLKCARNSEKEAAGGRQTLYKHYAKAGDSVKEELAEAKTEARSSVEQQEKAIAAIQALTNEQYDANQVVEAYESRKRPRQDGE